MRALENRIPPPFLVLGLLALQAGVISPPPSHGVVGWVVMAVSFAGAAVFGFPALAGFFRAGTTIDPVHVERASVLVTSGIYAVSRNPMYVSLTLLLCTQAAWLGSPWAWVGPVFFVVFITRFQIIPEERMLTDRFGDAYIDWCGRVRRWL
ncbi:MAG: isoprenylcysteine carboxylmethyltransferase family protein [Proteobacteria bacterium]|nr:isoprenylcysteine carboxylmethyltransferase family protein [Pseudomonadota bacterium]